MIKNEVQLQQGVKIQELFTVSDRPMGIALVFEESYKSIVLSPDAVIKLAEYLERLVV